MPFYSSDTYFLNIISYSKEWPLYYWVIYLKDSYYQIYRKNTIYGCQSGVISTQLTADAQRFVNIIC